MTITSCEQLFEMDCTTQERASFAFLDNGNYRQARVVDIHEYYRDCGIDWDDCQQNFDAVIIRACVGFNTDELLAQHVDGCRRYNIPYATYFLIDPARDITAQVAHYLSLYGVLDAKTLIFDWERPYSESRTPTSSEAWLACRQVTEQAGRQPWVYTRPSILDENNDPPWLNDYWLWIAQYYLTDAGYYTRFDPFLQRYAWELPKYMTGKSFENRCILWQFTQKGDAQYYLANEYTCDPKWNDGIKSADLNVSICAAGHFMALFGEATAPPIEPPEPPIQIRRHQSEP